MRKNEIDKRKIYDTKKDLIDVNDFEMNKKVNRAIVGSNVATFLKLMEKDEYDPERSLIMVDASTYTILDGQHRVSAYKEAQKKCGYNKGLLVRFVEAPKGVEALQKYIQGLQKGRSWELEDYITANFYAKNDLRKIKQFCLAHPFLYNENDVFWRKGTAIITKDLSNTYKKRLKERNVRFSKEDWDTAEDRYEEITTLMEALGKKWTDGSFEYIVDAWKTLKNDMDTMVKIYSLPYKFDTVFAALKNRTDYPSGQGKKVWYNFFVETVEMAAKAAMAA